LLSIMNRSTFFCGSIDFLESFENPTFFCKLSGKPVEYIGAPNYLCLMQVMCTHISSFKGHCGGY
jgi:hypothetical protein